MRRSAALVLGVIGYGWLVLFAVVTVASCTANGLRAGDVLGFIGRTQDFFSPFNVANYIVMLLAASPGLGALWLRGKVTGAG